MSGVTLDSGVLAGLDHRQSGALAHLLLAAAEAEPRGALDCHDAVLAEAAGFGVQIGAWKRMARAVLRDWHRVVAADGRVLLAWPGLYDGPLTAAPEAAAATDRARPLDGPARAQLRERVKMRRRRAIARGEAQYMAADGRMVSVSVPVGAALSPQAAGTVPGQSPPESPPESPRVSPGLPDPDRVESAESSGFASGDAGARENGGGQSPLRSRPEVRGQGDRVAPARVGDSGSTISPETTISTTTTTVDNPAGALAGAGAAARDGRVVVVGGGNIAELQDRAAERLVERFLSERHSSFPSAPPPSKSREKLKSVCRQWFAEGATEQLIDDVIRCHMKGLHSAPNTIFVFRHSVAAAIRESAAPRLALARAHEGPGVRVSESLQPHLPVLLRHVDAAAVKSWFAHLAVKPDGPGQTVLEAPTRFIAKQVSERYGRVLDAVFGAGRWRMSVAIPSQGEPGKAEVRQ